MSEISYSKKNDNVECVRYKDWSKSYPPHTHTGHLTIGYIEEGSICLVMNGVAEIYSAGDKFQIPPDVLHEIRTVDGKSYSMVVLCFAVDDAIGGGAFSGALSGTSESDYEHAVARLSELRKNILENPENIYLIEQMAHSIAADAGFYDQSHMDRCFKKVVGLSPKEYKKAVKPTTDPD